MYRQRIALRASCQQRPSCVLGSAFEKACPLKRSDDSSRAHPTSGSVEGPKSARSDLRKCSLPPLPPNSVSGISAFRMLSSHFILCREGICRSRGVAHGGRLVCPDGLSLITARRSCMASLHYTVWVISVWRKPIRSCVRGTESRPMPRPPPSASGPDAGCSAPLPLDCGTCQSRLVPGRWPSGRLPSQDGEEPDIPAGGSPDRPSSTGSRFAQGYSS